MVDIKHAMKAFSKAQLSSWLSSILDYAVTIFLAVFFDVWYVYATFIGALAGGILNCTINYKWVFSHDGRRKRSIAFRYLMVWSVSIILNTLGTFSLTEATAISFVIVKAVVAIVVALVWNYQMQRLYVFNGTK